LSQTILYVDDDRANLKVLAAMCADEFEVVTAPGGTEALEILRGREIAVLLVDQRMPHMTGVELLEVAAREAPDAVRILITAYADLSAAIDAINRGQVGRYLRKPWEPDDLKATLREALDTYALKRRLREQERRLIETERVYGLGVIAGGLAHELRTPLTVVSGALDMALKDARDLAQRLEVTVGPGTPETSLAHELVEWMTSARNSAGRLGEIVAGVDLGQRRTKGRRQADLAEVVRLTAAGAQGELRRHGSLVLDLQTVPPVAGSTTALGQVTLNLLANAIEAISGSRCDHHVVTVRLGQEGGRVRLDVEDSGPGMEPQVLDRIFDPFFTTKEEGGTGLGLAISKRIVEEIGGTISVDSVLGRGTCFTVRLPVAPPDGGQAPPAAG
jgi:signal transduction histidine kinase